MKSIDSQPWILAASFLLLGSLGTGGPGSAARAADELGYRSVAERTLEKRFVQHSELKLVDMKLSVEGPNDPEVPELEVPSEKIVDDETIEFSDETLVAGDGGPKKLKRSFTSIENSFEVSIDEEGAEDITRKNESGLAGKAVLFTWNDEDKQFEASWFEDEGDDKLLEAMVEDADFRAWLPGKKVEEGDTWTIPASEFNNLQEPSGPMGYRPEGSSDEPDKDPASDELRANVKGEFEATYKGTRDEDGVKLGVIAFEAKLNSSSEHEVEQEGASASETTETSTELQGELLWDLAGGHFFSLSCESELKLTTTKSQSFEIDGETYTLTEQRTLEGNKTYRFSCAVKKD